MKKVLCCVLVALLAALPCCGVAEGSFYDVAYNEIDYWVEYIEYVLSVCGNCELFSSNDEPESKQYLIRCTNDNGETFLSDVTFYAASNGVDVGRIIFNLLLNEENRYNVDYQTYMHIFPYMCLKYLDTAFGLDNTDSEFVKAFDLLNQYAYKGNMDEVYYYEIDYWHWTGFRFTKLNTMPGAYSGRITFDLNISEM